MKFSNWLENKGYKNVGDQKIFNKAPLKSNKNVAENKCKCNCIGCSKFKDCSRCDCRGCKCEGCKCSQVMIPVGDSPKSGPGRKTTKMNTKY